MRLRPARRPGFTLLEVLLASALAVVLMAALYVALDVQLRLAADGREAIDQAVVGRAIVQRFENDLACSLSPVAPPVGKTSGAGGSAGAAGGSAGGASGAAAGGATGAGASGGTSTSGSGSGMTGAAAGGAATGDAVQDAVTTTDAPVFQAGVIGETDGERPRLTLFVARVAGLTRLQDESADAPTPADVRRVTYWMTDHGLARMELPWVTSEQAQGSTDPIPEDGKEEKDYVIADEVTRVQFEFWDGSAWADTWDGRQPGADGKTPMGPPMAIRVRFWINVPAPERGQTVEKEFRHTIAVRGAPGQAAAATTGTMP